MLRNYELHIRPKLKKMQKEAKEELGCTFENMHCILDQQISYIRI
jgi:hypothetical protein